MSHILLGALGGFALAGCSRFIDASSDLEARSVPFQEPAKSEPGGKIALWKPYGVIKDYHTRAYELHAGADTWWLLAPHPVIRHETPYFLICRDKLPSHLADIDQTTRDFPPLALQAFTSPPSSLSLAATTPELHSAAIVRTEVRNNPYAKHLWIFHSYLGDRLVTRPASFGKFAADGRWNSSEHDDQGFQEAISKIFSEAEVR